MKIVYLDDGYTGSWLTTKYAKALQDGGAEVEVVYLTPQTALPTAGLYDNSVPVRMLGIRGRGQRVKMRLAFARLYWYLLATPADCYIAAGPDTLGICRLAAKFHRARSIYIPFEYYPYLSYGTPETLERFAAVERKHIPQMSAVVLLGDKIAEDYQSIYGLNDRFHLVYSGWPTKGNNLRRSTLRDALGATKRERIILYQGGISMKRGLVKVVEALPYLPPDAIFVILGYGPDGSLIQERAREIGVADRVRILPAVPQKDLIAYTAGADIGIIPILNICRSYDLCCPSKLFEFIAAGLPLAVSNLAQLALYVRTRELGEVFDPENPRDIARALRHLLEDDTYRAQCAENSRKTQLCEASWEIQSEKLRRVILGT
jgi:glycosyltransferase involved in cell wall biosynthesis